MLNEYRALMGNNKTDRLYLYNRGDECIATTGGWIAPNTLNVPQNYGCYDSNRNGAATIYRTKQADHLYLATEYDQNTNVMASFLYQKSYSKFRL